jgi:hypothetical protein
MIYLLFSISIAYFFSLYILNIFIKLTQKYLNKIGKENEKEKEKKKLIKKKKYSF